MVSMEVVEIITKKYVEFYCILRREIYTVVLIAIQSPNGTSTITILIGYVMSYPRSNKSKTLFNIFGTYF
jgi:hypothetical protein